MTDGDAISRADWPSLQNIYSKSFAIIKLFFFFQILGLSVVY